MVETRSGVGATAQTSFWALAALLISVGAAIAEDAGGDNQRLLMGLAMVICGVVLVFAKYYIKLPDVSEREMMETIAVMASTYEELIKQAKKAYEDDVHAFRDEVVQHRRIIEATAAMLPAKWQVYLREVLDALEGKYQVPN